jgi:hypothetical protein
LIAKEEGDGYARLGSASAGPAVLSVLLKTEEGQLERLLDRHAIPPGEHLRVLRSPLLYVILHEGGLSSTTACRLPAADEDGRPFDHSRFRPLTEAEKDASREAFLESSILHLDDYQRGSLKVDWEEEEEEQQQQWVMEGPPDFCRVRRLASLPPSRNLSDWVYGPRFVRLLEEVTGLDLGLPRRPVQVWSLSAGSYRLLPGGKNRDSQPGLDLYLCLESSIDSSAEPSEEWGEVLYVADATGEVVGRVSPRANRLSLAYRSAGASRFIRYIPREAEGFHAKLLAITYPVREDP